MATKDPTRQMKSLGKSQAKAAHDAIQAGRPATNVGAGQITDILKTGGMQAQIPAVQSMQQNFDAATRQANMQIGDMLSRIGGVEGVGTQANAAMGAQQNQSIAQMLAPFFMQAMGSVPGAGQAGTAGIQGAAQTMAQTPQEGAHLQGLVQLAGFLGQLASASKEAGGLQQLLQQMGLGGGATSNVVPPEQR